MSASARDGAARGLVVAAARSGAGKTTVTLALLAAWRRRGLMVRAAKSGPDYIDPAFHHAATGHPCPNLDSWAMPPPLCDAVLAGLAGGDGLVVVESAMGLFDGVAGPPGRSGSAADLAARHQLPVLLVLDVSGQSQSAAAVARGFMTHDPGVQIAGIVLNRVGSERHREAIARALQPLGTPLLGSLPREPTLTLPERHLGLVQAGEYDDLPARLDALAALAERYLDLAAIGGLAAPLRPAGGSPGFRAPGLRPPGQRIAVAQDAAFSFLYPHLLDGWRAAGAQIVRFSPLADEAPPSDCDACWLPGGYPELHAPALAAAGRFRTGMAAFATSRRVHGECGGHMVLGAALEDAAGVMHPMLGLLSHVTSFARRKLHLGYRQASLLADASLGPRGAELRGHEFHYASVIDAGTDAPLAAVADAQGSPLGEAGGVRGLVSGSFFHVIAPA